MSNSTKQEVQVVRPDGITKCQTAAQLPKDLIMWQVAAEACVLSIERVEELLDAGYIRHWKIDGERYLRPYDLELFIRKHLVEGKCRGAPFPDLRVLMFQGGKPDPSYCVPFALQGIKNLRQHAPGCYPPVVYFLCESGNVVYVGQTIRLMSRLERHYSTKKFDYVYFLPVPESDLLRVESAFISALNPPLNKKQVLYPEQEKILEDFGVETQNLTD